MANISHLERMGIALKCSICLSLFNSAVSLPCNHVFCDGCILKSMKVDAICPLCKIPYYRREIRRALYMDSLVNIYKNMEEAYRVNLLVSQQNPNPSAKEKHVKDDSINKISVTSQYDTLFSEPLDLSKYFSSYEYESPMMDTSDGLEFSDLGENECLKFDCNFSEPTDEVVEDSDTDDQPISGSIFRKIQTKKYKDEDKSLNTTTTTTTTTVETELTNLRNRVNYLEDEVRKLHDLIRGLKSS